MNSQSPLRLGDILVQKGLISEEKLKKALNHQKTYGGRLGNILIDFGWIEESVIKEVSQLIPQKLKLGEMLVNQGILTEAQLSLALEYQRKSGGLLGDIILSLGLVEAHTLFRVIASQQGIGRIGSQFAIYSSKIPEEIAREYKAIVVHTSLNQVVVAVEKVLTKDQINSLESMLGYNVEQVLATHTELESLWRQAYSSELMDISTKKLAIDSPGQSAQTVLTKRQTLGLVIIVIVVIIGMFLDIFKTFLTINIIIQIAYFVVSVLKFLMIFRGTRPTSQIRFSDEELAAIDERDLPVYTILVPMYKESSVIRKLVENLERLDYPKVKLDIRLLIEEDDVEAQELLNSMDLPYYYTSIVVPHSKPKTKPKACNYGLIHARGKYVVIYDAEDRPEPDQLKKVHLAFNRSPDSCCCIQAKLNYFNSEQNLLTRWFTQEYSMWFDLLLPGLMQLDIPIPLGGTSNHFKTEILKKLNAWDPYNVTEDADLGIRLYGEGFTTGIVDSRTWEEANSRVGNWIRQRSRWIKGYMLTWFVHMRFPFRLWRQIGTRGMIGLQVIVLATPLLPLINPFLWTLILLWYLTHNHMIPMMFPGPIYYIAAVELIIGNFLFVFSNVAGVYRVIGELHAKSDYALSFRIIKYALLTPLYWMLMSVAAYKAAWQLIFKPFYWEKTVHGLAENVTENIFSGSNDNIDASAQIKRM
ncbi:glycosyltransferase family 2 protein [Desulfosporosinus youngiae]|uniref:Glycosyl transferase n=1 Tax=Desulfosporosinus youngiae DSM 17734 TaxID=768710 RepID=H5XSG1_9FIRM|nr:glycosyltransferase family 2 protein [Desulfosporosinus youngiae]EHQ88061.1 glycosyl transferase [Desulfosporosinus youngiae DSM 17734]